MRIKFQPIFIGPIDNGLFVTPIFSNLMPTLVNGTVLNDVSDVTDYFVNLFHNLFAYLGLKEDIYSMGKFSNYIAEKLNMLPEAVERRNVSILP